MKPHEKVAHLSDGLRVDYQVDQDGLLRAEAVVHDKEDRLVRRYQCKHDKRNGEALTYRANGWPSHYKSGKPQGEVTAYDKSGQPPGVHTTKTSASKHLQIDKPKIMAPFEEAHFGAFISSERSDCIKVNTSDLERTRVAVQHGMSESAIRSIIYRRVYLTKDNYSVIVSLMRIAVNNYTKFKEVHAHCASALAEKSQ